MSHRENYHLDETTWSRGRNAIVFVAFVSILACVYGYLTDPRQFMASYLVAFMYPVTIALGAMFFVMIQHLTGSAWSVTVRRMMENIMITTPVAILLFIPIAFNLPVLYEWALPGFYAGEPSMRFKTQFFSPTYFLARMVVYFIAWTVLGVNLYRHSVAQDREGRIERHRKAAWWSAPGLLILMVTVTMASVDWLMSLDPHWYSTIFGVYVYSGGVLAFLAALTLICLAFRGAGLLRETITVEHYHDLGKWLFALTVFWAYIAFSQYLLIWYANIPEETIWFRHRLEGNWAWVSALLLLGHFVLPFVVLLARAAKRNLAVLGAISGWILLMHLVDLHWVVMPAIHAHSFHLHWMDIATWVGVGSVYALVFWSGLRRNAMVPVGDLRFEQGLHFRNV